MSPYVAAERLRSAGFSDGHAIVLQAGVRIPLHHITESPGRVLRFNGVNSISLAFAVDRILPFPILAESEITQTWYRQNVIAGFSEPISGFAATGLLVRHNTAEDFGVREVRLYCEMAEGDVLSEATAAGLAPGNLYRLYMQYVQGLVISEGFLAPH